MFQSATNAVTRWDFTLKTEGTASEELKKFLSAIAKKWCFQLERGEENGFLHYQGRVSLKVRTKRPKVINGAMWVPH